MKDVFEIVCAYYQRSGVTYLARRVIGAEFRNPTTIVSTSITEIYAGDNLIQQPLEVVSVLQQIDDVWLLRHSEYAITDASEYGEAIASLDEKAPQPPREDDDTGG